MPVTVHVTSSSVMPGKCLFLIHPLHQRICLRAGSHSSIIYVHVLWNSVLTLNKMRKHFVLIHRNLVNLLVEHFRSFPAAVICVCIVRGSAEKLFHSFYENRLIKCNVELPRSRDILKNCTLFCGFSTSVYESNFPCFLGHRMFCRCSACCL